MLSNISNFKSLTLEMIYKIISINSSLSNGVTQIYKYVTITTKPINITGAVLPLFLNFVNLAQQRRVIWHEINDMKKEYCERNRLNF